MIILLGTYKLFSFFICFIRQKHRGIVFIEMRKTCLGCRLETQVCFEQHSENFRNREDTILVQDFLISIQSYAALSDGLTIQFISGKDIAIHYHDYWHFKISRYYSWFRVIQKDRRMNSVSWVVLTVVVRTIFSLNL